MDIYHYPSSKHILLDKIEAQVGTAGQRNPQIATFQIKGYATTANGHKFDLNNCLMTARAVGNISSMRVDMAPMTLECTSPSGRKFISVGTNGQGSTNLKGYIVDSAGDGGIGLERNISFL